jgi:monoterpene epsilon-lactone hydrolase
MVRRAISYSGERRGGISAPPAVLDRRRAMDAAGSLPDGVRRIAEPRAPGRSEWLIAEIANRAVIMFVHGSGYSKGSPASHRSLASEIVRKSQASVLVVDYRLTPEHPFPAALDDSLHAYRLLLSENAASDIVLVGDSAGGGLVLATLLAAHDEGLPLPAGAVTMSAWTDLAVTGPSVTDPSVDDPLVTGEMLRTAAALYLDGADAHHPYASPLYGPVEHLPPLLMQVGDREVMRDDTLRFAKKARDAGIEVSLAVFDGCDHVFQLKDLESEHAKRAITAIASFIWDVTGTGTGEPTERDQLPATA